MGLAPGEYTAEVMSTQLTTTETGTPFIIIRFSTAKGEMDGWFCLNEASLPYTIEKLDNIGWTGDEIGELDQTDILVGKRCFIVVGEEEYKGKIRPRVKFVNKFHERRPVDTEQAGDVNGYLKKLRSGAFKKDKKGEAEVDEPAFH